MTVSTLAPSEAAATTELLCSAFVGYPVMRYVLGQVPDYPQRLRILIGLFVANRVYREDLILGVRSGEGRLRAAAIVTLPGDRPPPPALIELRESVWHQLGADAHARYDAFAAAAPLPIDTPHHHLNMIGVDPAHTGRGLARLLLNHLHALADADEGSTGISLSTETPANVPLYRHFGYRELNYERVSPELETWSFFRPTARAAGT